MGRDWNHRALLTRMLNGVAYVESSGAAPQNIKRRINTGSSDSLLSMFPKSLEAGTPTPLCSPMFMAALARVAKK